MIIIRWWVGDDEKEGVGEDEGRRGRAPPSLDEGGVEYDASPPPRDEASRGVLGGTLGWGAVTKMTGEPRVTTTTT
eukprot:6643866-Pyramimonas_sp.AAC.1